MRPQTSSLNRAALPYPHFIPHDLHRLLFDFPLARIVLCPALPITHVPAGSERHLRNWVTRFHCPTPQTAPPRLRSLCTSRRLQGPAHYDHTHHKRTCDTHPIARTITAADRSTHQRILRSRARQLPSTATTTTMGLYVYDKTRPKNYREDCSSSTDSFS